MSYREAPPLPERGQVLLTVYEHPGSACYWIEGKLWEEGGAPPKLESDDYVIGVYRVPAHKRNTAIINLVEDACEGKLLIYTRDPIPLVVPPPSSKIAWELEVAGLIAGVLGVGVLSVFVAGFLLLVLSLFG